MRKYLVLTALITSLNANSFSQDSMILVLHKKMDSLKTIVYGKAGKEKVDDLNRIVDLYQVLDEDNQMQVDSATPYAKQALAEATRINYKRGLGYASLKMTYCEWRRNDIYLQKNKKSDPGIIATQEYYAKLALNIGKKLDDHTMIGSAYSLSGWTEHQKGNIALAISLQKQAIASMEKMLNNKPSKEYKEMEYSFCPDCKVEELRIAWFLFDIIILEKGKNDSEKYFDQAILHYQKAGSSQSEIGGAYIRFGNVSASMNNTEKAAAYYKQAASIFQKAGNQPEELYAIAMTCASYYAMGDYEKGFDYSKKSIRLAEKLLKETNLNREMQINVGRAFFWMGRYYSIAGDNETGIKYIHRSIYYFKNDPTGLRNSKAILGDMYRRKGNYDSALYYLAPFENETKPSNGKLYLAVLYTDLKQFDKALKEINIIIDAHEQSGNMVNLGNDYSVRARIWLGKKDYAVGMIDAMQAYMLLRESKRHSVLADNCMVLSDIFFQLGKYDSAYYYLKQNTLLKDSLLNRQFYIRLNDYKKEAEEQKRISQINLLNKDNQLKEQKIKQQAIIRNSLIIGLVLLLLLGIFIFRNLIQKRRNALEKQKLESEKKQVELKMQALRAQMNPHFIFNCLSSINRFILKNEGKAASNYLTRFSRLMRMVLNNSQKSFILLDDELEMLELYLEMERLRFKNSFDYGITFLNTVDSDNIFIPPLLLQPFCENAIWHGLMNKEGQGRLDIELSMENNILNCVIRDNGVGREKSEELKSKTAEKEKSMGLKITTERLALLNREKGLHTFYDIEDLKDENRAAAGTKVNLKISFKQSVEELV